MLFSGVFLVLLLWLGTREVLAGRLTIGQLISFLGYGLYLIGPIRTFFEFAQKVTRALVSARKAIAIFEPEPPWRDRPSRAALDGDAATSSTTLSGLRRRARRADDRGQRRARGARPRWPTGWAATSPPTPSRSARSDEEGLKGRAARVARSERRPSARRDRRPRRRARAPAPGGSGSATSTSPTPRSPTYARTILVSDTGSQLFAGTLQDAVDPHRRLTREQAEEALLAANAEDVYDALPGGWQGELDERGRGLSGGQRQRVVLARALAADAPILVLVEPTSAVDAHTEARIAERVAGLRAGRTTVVCTVSPLWLHHADRVVAAATTTGSSPTGTTRTCWPTTRPTARVVGPRRWTRSVRSAS